jgi:tRNA (cmo5U34)-methyltransferase
MNEFDAKARDWDKNQRYIERSEAVARVFLQLIPIKPGMKALEYGSGTALLSFALKDHFSSITLMDNSAEMTQVTIEKISEQKIRNMKPMLFDLEHQDYAEAFDIIYSQMVMHHLTDIDGMLSKFFNLLNPGGYLAIADLYSEDGSFHSEGFNGHHGFDVHDLQKRMEVAGFINVTHQPCFVITKTDEEGNIMEYPIFLMVGEKLLK